MHRETAAVPADRLDVERELLHPLPAEPYALALGEERLVGDDQTVRFGSVRYSTPPGHVGDAGVVPGRRRRTGHRRPHRRAAWARSPGTVCPRRAARRICDEHYPHHPGGNGPRPPRRGRGPKPRRRSWLSVTARTVAGRGRRVRRAADPGQDGPRGRARRHRRRRHGRRCPGLAAIAGRFADGDLVSIVDHLAAEREIGEVLIADETHSVQPGTAGWARLGEKEAGR